MESNKNNRMMTGGQNAIKKSSACRKGLGLEWDVSWIEGGRVGKVWGVVGVVKGRG